MSDDVFLKSDMAKSMKQPQAGVTVGMPSAFKNADMIQDYNTGNNFIQKNQNQLDQEMLDMELGGQRRPFTRDDFKMMID
jgi:hypothetical protein